MIVVPGFAQEDHAYIDDSEEAYPFSVALFQAQLLKDQQSVKTLQANAASDVIAVQKCIEQKYKGIVMLQADLAGKAENADIPQIELMIFSSKAVAKSGRLVSAARRCFSLSDSRLKLVQENVIDFSSRDTRRVLSPISRKESLR